MPHFDEETSRYYLGVSAKDAEAIVPKGFELFRYSAYEVRYWLRMTVKTLGMLVQGKVSRDDVAGPVGIAVMIGDTVNQASPAGFAAVLLSMVNIAILLSANLGIINLLPLPALDGGRLVFLIAEVVRGKPVPPSKEAVVHFIGFAVLMVLMVFVLFNDIARLLRR